METPELGEVLQGARAFLEEATAREGPLTKPEQFLRQGMKIREAVEAIKEHCREGRTSVGECADWIRAECVPAELQRALRAESKGGDGALFAEFWRHAHAAGEALSEIAQASHGDAAHSNMIDRGKGLRETSFDIVRQAFEDESEAVVNVLLRDEATSKDFASLWKKVSMWHDLVPSAGPNLSSLLSARMLQCLDRIDFAVIETEPHTCADLLQPLSSLASSFGCEHGALPRCAAGASKFLVAEFRKNAFAAIAAEAWEHHQPHHTKDSRPSAGIILWDVRLRGMIHDAKIMGPAGTWRLLSLLSASLASIAELQRVYRALAPRVSRARSVQYRIDCAAIFMHARQIYDLAQSVLDRSQVQRLERKSLEILAMGLVLSGPCHVVTDWLKSSKPGHGEFDSVVGKRLFQHFAAEAAGRLASLSQSSALSGNTFDAAASACIVGRAMDVYSESAKSALGWGNLLRSNIMRFEDVRSLTGFRQELRDDEWPPLTEDSLAAKKVLTDVLL
eukprot:g4673.t1